MINAATSIAIDKIGLVSMATVGVVELGSATGIVELAVNDAAYGLPEYALVGSIIGGALFAIKTAYEIYLLYRNGRKGKTK